MSIRQYILFVTAIMFHGGTIMPHQSRRKFTNPKTGDNTDARTSPLQPHIVKPEHAVPMKAFGLDLKVLISTEDTGGAISVLRGWHKSGEGPGDHVHFSQEEMFFIVEGTYEMTVGGHTTMAGPGTIVFIPRCLHPAQCRASLQERRRHDG